MATYKINPWAAWLIGTVLSFANTHQLRAASEENFTYLRQPTEPSRVMQYGHTHRLINKKHHARWNGVLGINAFYRKNIFSKRMAQGLGFKGQDTFDIQSLPASADDLDIDFLLHNKQFNTPGAASTTGFSPINSGATFAMHPEHRALGLNLNYYQQLDFFIDKLFAQVNISVVRSRNKLFPTFVNMIKGSNLTSIADFLAGKHTGLEPVDALKFGLIDTLPREKTNLTDLDFRIGYNFVDYNLLRISGAVVGSVPYGTTSSAKKLFEVVIGSQNYTLGLEASAFIEIWKYGPHTWSFFTEIEGRYQNPGTEIRIARIKDRNWGQYQIGQIHEATDGTNLFPMANVLAQSTKIHAQKLGSILALFSYHYRTMTFDIGYNCGYIQEEHNELTVPWPDRTYAIVNKNINPANYGNTVVPSAFDINGVINTGTATDQSDQIINYEDLEINLPQQLIFTWFASLGHHLMSKNKDWSLAGNVGAALEICNPARTYVPNYRLWAQASLIF